MALLKKIRASTLMETLVATVLIVVIFVIASMVLNNVFYNTIKSNTSKIEAYSNEIRYFHSHGKIMLPYYDDFQGWEITLEVTNKKAGVVELKAVKPNTGQHFLKQWYED